MKCRQRVLVVDDNVDGADTSGCVLRLHGHEVVVCYDGPSAVLAAASFEPNICLLDIGLPGMDGYELATLLRDMLGGSALLIAVTGYAASPDVARALAAGFDHHIAKPAPLDLVLALVEEQPADR